MRLRVVWFALWATSLCIAQVRADDFDDDFAQPRKPPEASEPEPEPVREPEPVDAPAQAGSESLAPPAPASPPNEVDAQSPYAAFDDGDEPFQRPARAKTASASASASNEVVVREPPVPASDDHYRDDTTPLPHATLTGLVGGLHLVDATGGPPRTFRIAVFGRIFKKNGWLYEADHHRRLSTVLALSVTPIEHLELSAALLAYATENDAADPRLVQALGDTTFSAKGYGTVLPGLSVAGAFELLMLNGTGGAGFAPDATSVGLRAMLSYDLRERERAFPVVLRTNLRYLFDNSRRLVGDVEAARYAALGADAAPPYDEYRHLVTPIERYQLNVNRVDRFTLGFGAEFPMKLGENFDIRPLIEWEVSLPVNRQDYDCLVPNAVSDVDGCLASEGFSARPSTLTFGVRSEPGIRGLSALLAIDVSTSGHGTVVRELAPNSRYELTAALAFAYDTRPPKPIIVEREKPPEEPKARGRVNGVVIDKEGGQPIARAIVHVEGSSVSDLATDLDGKFHSEELDAGLYPLTVSHEDYEPGACEAQLGEGELETNVRCELAPKPRRASVRGRVTNTDGAAIANASVELRGPGEPQTLTTDSDGAFAAQDLAEGSYEARAEAPGYLLRATPFEAKTKLEVTLSLVLAPVPTERLTELKTKNISIKKQVQFVADNAEISDKSSALLAEIADLLLRNPQLAKVEVQGHTDYTGTAAYNQELSQARAEAVRNALIAAGVDGNRLTAVGYGRSRPLVPNITEANRAKNRRVEFVILSTAP